jgi:hypothetical protein
MGLWGASRTRSPEPVPVGAWRLMPRSMMKQSSPSPESTTFSIDRSLTWRPQQRLGETSSFSSWS